MKCRAGVMLLSLIQDYRAAQPNILFPILEGYNTCVS